MAFFLLGRRFVNMIPGLCLEWRRTCRYGNDDSDWELEGKQDQPVDAAPLLSMLRLFFLVHCSASLEQCLTLCLLARKDIEACNGAIERAFS